MSKFDQYMFLWNLKSVSHNGYTIRWIISADTAIVHDVTRSIFTWLDQNELLDHGWVSTKPGMGYSQVIDVYNLEWEIFDGQLVDYLNTIHGNHSYYHYAVHSNIDNNVNSRILQT